MQQLHGARGAALTWFIDLDDTLHHASHAIFGAMHHKMNDYLAELLGDGSAHADEETVDRVRRQYWKKYGATLLGLIKHHGIDEADFLHRTHQFDNLADMVRFEPGLGDLLRRLPGRKIVFTNAPRAYARQVLGLLGLRGQGRHFDEHISIEAMRVHGRLCPKPSRQMLQKLLAGKRLKASRCVLIEDSRANLKSARQIGMKTVWVTQYLQAQAPAPKRYGRAGFIDLKVHSIRQLGRRLVRFNRG